MSEPGCQHGVAGYCTQCNRKPAATPLITAVERLLATLPQPGSRVWPDFYARLQVEDVRRELDKLK